MTPHFSYKNVNHLDGRAGGGTLRLEKLPDGTTILSGKTADFPNCRTCTNVGFIEPGCVGSSQDKDTGWFPEYRYQWEGVLRA
jgi:hypothetical protein